MYKCFSLCLCPPQALHYAAARGHEDVTLYLLQQQADPNVRDNFANTAVEVLVGLVVPVLLCVFVCGLCCVCSCLYHAVPCICFMYVYVYVYVHVHVHVHVGAQLARRGGHHNLAQLLAEAMGDQAHLAPTGGLCSALPLAMTMMITPGWLSLVGLAWFGLVWFGLVGLLVFVFVFCLFGVGVYDLLWFGSA